MQKPHGRNLPGMLEKELNPNTIRVMGSEAEEHWGRFWNRRMLGKESCGGAWVVQ